MKEWYIGFSENTQDPHWWQKPALLNSPPGFGHVCLYKPVTDSHLVFYDPAPCVLKSDMYELHQTVEETAKELSKQYTMLYFKHTPDEQVNLSFFVPSCVTMVKYMMGFNSKALTPYKLYKDLLKAGALKVE